jgi:hypothetical protein
MPSPPAEMTPAKTSMTHASARSRQDSDTNGILNDTGSTQELIANAKGVFEKLEKEAKVTVLVDFQ